MAQQGMQSDRPVQPRETRSRGCSQTSTRRQSPAAKPATGALARDLRASARASRGRRGGAPRQPQCSTLRVLAEPPNSGLASPAPPPKCPSGRRPEQRPSSSRGQAPRPRRRHPQGRRGRPARLITPRAAPRSVDRPVSGLPVPLGDLRSSLLGHPVARRFPENPPLRPKTGLNPRSWTAARPIRLRSPLSGARHALPTHP